VIETDSKSLGDETRLELQPQIRKRTTTEVEAEQTLAKKQAPGLSGSPLARNVAGDGDDRILEGKLSLSNAFMTRGLASICRSVPAKDWCPERFGFRIGQRY
jgi:hypothetical protein